MNKLNIDCLVIVFDNVDKNSLYSCLLVNKEWCSIVVPILWKNHNLWNESVTKLEKRFNTILSCLPSYSKQILFDNNIKLPSTILSKPPLFNYISFCEYLSATVINKIIRITFEKLDVGDHQKNLLEQEIYKLFISQCKRIKELHWETSQPLSLFLGASTCFSQLYYLYIDINFVDSNALYEMAQICKDLNKLTIKFCYQDIPGLISLIDAQRNLKGVDISYNRNKKGTCRELGKALERKGNTINYLRISPNSKFSPFFLTSLINLKELSICVDENDESNILQQCLAISEFPDLESLNVDGLLCFRELAMLIEKTKGNVSHIDAYIYRGRNNDIKNTGMLIKAIANNCPKIKSLSTFLDPKDFIHVKLLLLNCRYLKYIWFDSLDWYVDGNDEVGDELLDILTKFLPNSLTEICISPGWKYSIDAFEQFFESCRERTLVSFGFTFYDNNYITEDHEAIIEKYTREGVIIYS